MIRRKEIPANIGEYLKYDETSPSCLRWIKLFGNSRSVKIGDCAGSENIRGYFEMKVLGIRLYSHRIVFFLHNGYCPACLDHIDGNRSNNKIDNLRESTISENGFNRKISKNNSAGYKGISKHKKHNTVYWRVSIMKNNKSYQRNFSIDKFQEACDYADDIRKSLHGDFSNDGGVK